eukprot:SAG11_NODE_10682_length_812_cov_1.286115_1_plen_149_part_00
MGYDVTDGVILQCVTDDLVAWRYAGGERAISTSRPPACGCRPTPHLRRTTPRFLRIADLGSCVFGGAAGDGVSALRMESGGMIFDRQRNLTVAFADSPTNAFTSADPTLLSRFTSVGVLFSPTGAGPPTASCRLLAAGEPPARAEVCS